MKIAKALKQKNVLVGEFTKLKSQLQENNVRTDGKKFDYDNKDILTKALAKMDELISLKASIASANASVYGDIFRMAELKSFVQHLKSIPVKEGVEKQASYGGAILETTYFSAITRLELDELILKYEAEIQTIQDRLDTFNFTTVV